MKRKELKNLRALSIKELDKLIGEKNNELVEVKVNMAVSKAKNLKKAKMLRRDMSQISTILKERKLVEDLVQKDKKEKGGRD